MYTLLESSLGNINEYHVTSTRHQYQFHFDYIVAMYAIKKFYS